MNKILKPVIIILIILAVLIAPFIYLITPHYITRTIYIASRPRPEQYILDFDYYNDIGSSYYLATSSLGECYIAGPSLENIVEDNDEHPNCLGKQRLKVKFRSIVWYQTDNSGIFMRYPVIVYELAGDQ